jgi:excisionase family DNA binding protein
MNAPPTAPPAEPTKTAPTEPTYLTPKGVADLLRISRKSVYRIAGADAGFPVLRLKAGGAVRFHRARLLAWLERNEQGRGRRS